MERDDSASLASRAGVAAVREALPAPRANKGTGAAGSTAGACACTKRRPSGGRGVSKRVGRINWGQCGAARVARDWRTGGAACAGAAAAAAGTTLPGASVNALPARNAATSAGTSTQSKSTPSSPAPKPRVCVAEHGRQRRRAARVRRCACARTSSTYWSSSLRSLASADGLWGSGGGAAATALNLPCIRRVKLGRTACCVQLRAACTPR